MKTSILIVAAYLIFSTSCAYANENVFPTPTVQKQIVKFSNSLTTDIDPPVWPKPPYPPKP